MPTTKRQFTRALAAVDEVQSEARRAIGPYRGVTTKVITGAAATLVLSAADAQNSIIVLTGAMRAGGMVLEFPNGGNGDWRVVYAAVTGLGEDNALSFAVGTGVFGGQVTGTETSTMALVVSVGPNVAPAVLIGQ